MLGFRGKRSNPLPTALTDDNGFLRPPVPVADVGQPRYSTSKSESGHDYLGPPPSRSEIFAAYDELSAARSTRSLPTPTPTELSLSHSRNYSRDAISVDTAPPPLLDPPKKSKGMFSWAHRERKRSKPSAQAPSANPDDSFNLKSFRHVRPASPPPAQISPRSPSALSPPALALPQRPRGDSVASVDSSQRISVAAFREMAARRSAANSPSPSATDLSRLDASAPFIRPPSALSSPVASSPQLAARRPASRPPVSPSSPTSDSTSSESDADDADDDDSAGSSTLRPMRGVVNAPRSPGKSSSELGHRTRPTPPRIAMSASAQSSASGRESLYSRARASQSTSALMPNAAAKRASLLAASNTPSPVSTTDLRRKLPAKDSSSDSDSSDDSDTDSDNAPLAKLVLPKRPGSSASNVTAGSRTRLPPKPLIDISGLSPPVLHTSPESEKTSNPLDVKEVGEKNKEQDKENIREPSVELGRRMPAKEPSKEKVAVMSSEKPTLNDRLTRLAQSVAAGRASMSSAQEGARTTDDMDKTERGRSPLPQPKRSQTVPVDQFLPLSIPTSSTSTSTSTSASAAVSPPSPSKSKTNGRSMSTPNAFEGIKDLSDPTPIVPTPIRERSNPPAFSVTSRPTSQLSLGSLSLQIQHSPQQAFYQPQIAASGSGASSSLTSAAAAPPSPNVDASIRSASPAVTSVSSPAEMTESRASPGPRAPLIPDGGMHPPKGFTGGGLLASPAANPLPSGTSAAFPPSPVPSSGGKPSPSVRAARHRSATFGQNSPTREAMAPMPARPIALQSRGASADGSRPSGDSGEAPGRASTSSASTLSGSGTSASRSQDARSPVVAAKGAAPAQTRFRASTLGMPGATGSSGAGRDSIGMPPVKPFASTGLRGNSPASSTGESSSGRTPITPGDGSEISFTPRDRNRGRERGGAQAGPPPVSGAAARRTHRKSASVSFEDPERGRGLVDHEREERAAASAEAEESRRKERRRSEAKAALEVRPYMCAYLRALTMGGLQLGNIVNGRGPIGTDDDDDEDRPLDNMPPRMSMMASLSGMPMSTSNMNMNMNMTGQSPMSWQMQQPGMVSPQQYMFPMVPSSADSAYLAAHQQAMLVAKQAYQMAVAQQAMAAAEEEWERGSTAASVMGGGNRSGFGGNSMMFPGGNGFNMGMNGMNGMGIGIGMGMQGGWGGMLFPSSAQSMYAGSVMGSELGVGARNSMAWGSRSAYGDPNSNDHASMMRTSTFGMAPPPMPPRSELGVQQRPGPRPRTKTAPTSQPTDSRRAPPPPSSWKQAGRPA
ncbi:uncharacterized protein FIBRA_03211 [Fibroporia radiculosa]|uniref:Uncharacterized protein n=1 Tax=Fibroporia radiculosa TaxID=599839 RepID=J4G4K6_9APHY|nr:uncharacterized protein FIBRA_03211 [Fibroporia radiculosa]CCM01163.1 predicted protein [Fibroporia radiculosa]